MTPPTMDVREAADLLGIGKTLAYRLIREGEFPTPVLRLGRTARVPRVPLLRFLGLPIPADLAGDVTEVEP